MTNKSNDLPMVVTANLNSDQYKEAIEAHKFKQDVIISGWAKRTKNRARFSEVVNFKIEE